MSHSRNGLLAVLFFGLFVFKIDAQVTGVHRELYLNLTRDGFSLGRLTNHPNFLAGQPSQTSILTALQTPQTAPNLEDYGQRLRAYLIPPVTGDYTFWIASDETSTLVLSTNENPAFKRLIAWVDPRSQVNDYTTHYGQRSAPIPLQAGRIYYLEVLHHEANLIDHLSVQWQIPGGALENPIPSSRLVYEIPSLVVTNLTNLTVEEGRPVIFDPRVANFLPQSYRWQRNSGEIAGATNRTYTIPIISLGDNGALFRASITNQSGGTNTAEVMLTVLRDTNAPTVTRVAPANATNLFVFFSETMQAASALDPQNYRIGGATVQAAEFGEDAQTVILTTTPLVFDVGSSVSVSNLFDRASIPNALAPTNLFFNIVQQFNPQDLGNPVVTGNVIPVSGRSEVLGAGSGIGGTSDQFQFGWQSYMGDFDWRVRVIALDFTDLWARGGLMARESLSPTSRFAAVFTTPTLAGSFFQYRAVSGGVTTNTGSFPASYPNTWLRLKRQGSVFTGFASMDGGNWTQLGNVTMALSNRLYIGLAVTSQKTNLAAKAIFDDFSAPPSGGTIGAVAPARESLGPSSRKTGLVISEIMYHPRDVFSGTNKLELEFVELFNSNPYFEDISGYRLSGEIDYKFPPGTVLQGGSFLVVARAPADVLAFYATSGLSSVLGPFTNNLPNDSGRIRLRNQNDFILLEVNYSAKYPWPVAADGAGHSLALARPSYGENQREAWAASDAMDGSPGRLEPFESDPLRPIVINEFLAHTDSPAVDFIELYNRSSQPIDVGGAYLTDNANTNKFRIPQPTIIPGRGFVSFDQNQLGFSLNSSGERVFFINRSGTRVIDAVGFEPQANGVSSGRIPDGAPGFRELASRTPGATNAPPLSRDIVINEIMYHPISENSDDEFVELFNKGTNAVNLGGWRFTDGINFTFPSNTIIAAGGYVVVAKSRTNLLAHYGSLNTGNTMGDFGGTLANGGERIALAMPQLAIDADDPLNITTNTIHVVVNAVEYREGGQWGKWADGGGSSLELIDPRADNRLAPNWADSDETAKAPWTTIENTGVLDQGGDSPTTPDSLHVMMLEEGECLVDEVEVIPSGGGNRIANFNFESGLAGWTVRGNHERSSLELTGFNSSRSLHVRATSRGDTGPNKIHVPLTSALAGGNTATIRARVRWLRGWPEILLRLRGSYLEATDRMNVPLDLGTPGAPNSRLKSNAGPAITDVSHTPAVPAANQAIVVTARVADPDAVLSVTLNYYVDPNTNNGFAITMTDDGIAGDTVARDGIFSAIIPAQPANTVVAFTIFAVDAALPLALSRFPALRDDNGRTRECVVYFGSPTPASSFGTYRFWITQQSITNWAQREVLSNERILGTFVYGNQRVIYNAGARYSGSSAHQDMGGPDYSPIGTPNHYAFDMPGDDLLLGTDNFNKIHGAGNNHHDDNTLQRELVAYSVVSALGLPINYKRSVAMFINGARRGSLMEDTQVPNGDSVESVFPDDPDGDLFKISIWNEFPLTNTTVLQVLGASQISEAYLNNYTTTGGAKKRARYRWNFAQRAIHGTANDFTNLYTLVDSVTASANPAYTRNLNGLADMENWMRSFAVEHAVGNWDCFGYRNHQNMFAYKPEHGPWSLLIWDINIVFGGGTRGVPVGTNGDLLEIDSADVGISAVYNTPEYRRAYWRALKDVADGPFFNGNLDPLMDARFAAYTASGVNVDAPDYIKVWINQRRTYILSELAKLDTTNFTVSSGNFTANTNLIAISGVAPIGVRTVQVNGVAWPVTWTTLTNWTLRLPLAAATNQLTVIGLDGRGQPVAGASNQVTVAYVGDLPSPRDLVVINEIMYNPAAPDTSYVELFNLSTNFTFDLSGWRLNGADFTFPAGTFITNRQFLLVAGNRAAFAARYGLSNFVAGEFGGNLQNDGETLTLIRPARSSNELDLIADKVRYESSLPWSTDANGTGSSLQLIDPNQENSRVANWFSSYAPPVICCGASTPARTNDGWRFASATGSIGSGSGGGQFRLIMYLGTELGSALIDDVWLVDGPNAGAGANYIRNGDFESPLYEDPPLTNSWMVGTNYTSSVIIGSLTHAGSGALKMIPTTFGNSVTITATATNNRVIYQALSPAPTASSIATLSFWFWATNSSTNVNVRIVNSTPLNIATNINITFTPSNYVPPTVLTGAVVYASPGAPNQNATNLPPFYSTNLPPFPPLWINEVQAENVTGITDNRGEREPWIEIYNTSTNTVSLDGLFLSSNYTNLTNWAFPAGSFIGPTQFLVVFCDAQPVQTSNTEYHTSFRLSPASGSVALSRIYSGGPAILNGAQVLDYVNYAGLHSDKSFGSYPDGQPFDRLEFFYVTPRGTNDGRSAPLLVFINEWLVSNYAQQDPADGNFDDWFELYNPSTNTVELAGYYLTDSLTNAAGIVTNKFKYLITTNGPHTIGPRGYLLVWADNETGQNTTANGPRPDLHVNFQLSRFGEAIGLFAPDGLTIDYVTFGFQTDDVSVGRIPDGGANIVAMPGTVSPRAANHLSGPVNAPPVLDPIGNKAVNLGQTLSFTATGHDSDLPAQILTYDLIGAPAGATIGTGTGNFSWTPNLAGTYLFTVRVTDNGSPARSAEETITVQVTGLMFGGPVRRGNNLELTWGTQAGQKYAVDASSNLNAPVVWIPQLTGTASGLSFSYTNTTTNVPQRFFRVRSVP